MKTILLSLCLGVSAAVLTGCEPVPHYNRTQVVGLAGAPIKVAKTERKPVSTIKLFQDKAEVPQPYTVLGLMSVEGGAGDEARFIQAMLHRAADMGADAVILQRGNTIAAMEGGFNAWAGGFRTTQTGVYRAEAIRFK